jgi:hypothetical protein
MNNHNYRAKERIIKKLQDQSDAAYATGKYNDQFTGAAALDHIELYKGLNRMQMFKLEREVLKAEYYDPSKDKWGFGPVKVHPTDYVGFLKDLFPNVDVSPLYK